MKFEFSSGAPSGDSTLILPLARGVDVTVWEDRLTTRVLRKLAAAAKHSGFAGEFLESRTLSVVGDDDFVVNVVLLGLGEVTQLDALRLRAAGAMLPRLLDALGAENVSLLTPVMVGISHVANELAFGSLLAKYRFAPYRTDSVWAAPARTLTLYVDDPIAAATEHASRQSLACAVARARDLVNEPPNKLGPAAFASRCEELRPLGLLVEVLDQQQLQAMGMGALLAVAQGSTEPAAVVVLRWEGNGHADDAPVVLVGKGVTFDSGGLLPKGPEEMWDMKNDMAGAAVVTALLASLAERRVPMHVVGLLGLVENMPSGHAVRPGDVVTSLSGQTIEVLHPDAEGRLVLADLLWFAQQQMRPNCLINIATLTGAMTAVLGREFAGLFSNEDDLANTLLKAGEDSGERLWRLPMCDAFDRLIDSPIADMQNITRQRIAGSATAAQFLARFVDRDCAWAHLDICATAWRKDPDPHGVPGATGYGVLLLDRLLQLLRNKAEFSANRAREHAA